MIEKLCPQPVKVMNGCRDSIAERRSAKLATRGRNVNLSPQKIQLPIKDDISEGDISSDETSPNAKAGAGTATPNIVLSVSAPKLPESA